MSNENAQSLTPEQEKALAIKERKQKVGSLLQNYLPQLAEALPKILTPEKMMRVALTAMNKNPKLLECTNTSLIGSILTSAQLGLLPDEVLGEAYLIPFKNTRANRMECQFMIGYKGLCTLAYRSGVVESVQARAVFKGDNFEFEMGLNEKLIHHPKGNKNPLEITHFYAIVRMKGGGYVMNVMTREEVEKIRNESANYKFAQYKESTVWGKYFEEMGCKTVLRRIMKYVPMSSEIMRGIGQDEAADLGKQNFSADIIDLDGLDEDLKDEALEEIAKDETIQDAEIVEEELFKKEEKTKKAEADVLDKLKPKKNE